MLSYIKGDTHQLLGTLYFYFVIACGVRILKKNCESSWQDKLIFDINFLRVLSDESEIF